MADLQKLAHGELSWDAKINNIIDYLEDKVGSNGLEWTDWSNDGIVFQNGFQNHKGRTKYRYAQVGNAKIVELNIDIALSEDLKTYHNVPALTYPDNIYMDGYEEHLENAQFQLMLGENRLLINAVQNYWWVKDSHYTMHTVYVHKD